MSNTKIVDGLRRLSAQQKPGETLTTHEIAAECGVTERAIAQIEQQAKARVFRILLRKQHRSMLREIFPRHPLFPCASS